MSSTENRQNHLPVESRVSDSSPTQPLLELDKLPAEILGKIFSELFLLRFHEPCTLKEEREQNYGLDKPDSGLNSENRRPKQRWRYILASKRIYAIGLASLYRHNRLLPREFKLFRNRIKADHTLGIYVHSLELPGSSLTVQEMREVVELMPNLEHFQVSLKSENDWVFDLTGLNRLRSLRCQWVGWSSSLHEQIDSQVLLPETISTFVMSSGSKAFSQETLRDHISQLPRLENFQLKLDQGDISVDFLERLPPTTKISTFCLTKRRNNIILVSSLTNILSKNQSLCTSLVILNIGGIFNSQGNLDEVSQLLVKLPETVRYLDISGTYLTKAHVADLQRICRQVQEIRLGSPMKSLYGRQNPARYDDMLRMEDVEEIILGSTDALIEPSTVLELDISSLYFPEQKNLYISKLVNGTLTQLRTITVNKGAFGREILTWASETGK